MTYFRPNREFFLLNSLLAFSNIRICSRDLGNTCYHNIHNLGNICSHNIRNHKVRNLGIGCNNMGMVPHNNKEQGYIPHIPSLKEAKLLK